MTIRVVRVVLGVCLVSCIDEIYDDFRLIIDILTRVLEWNDVKRDGRQEGFYTFLEDETFSQYWNYIFLAIPPGCPSHTPPIYPDNHTMIDCGSLIEETA